MVSPVSSMVSPPSQLLHSRLLTRKALVSIVAKTKDELDTDLQPGEGASCVVQRDGSFPYSFSLPVPCESSADPTAGSPHQAQRSVDNFGTQVCGRYNGIPESEQNRVALWEQVLAGEYPGSQQVSKVSLGLSRAG